MRWLKQREGNLPKVTQGICERTGISVKQSNSRICVFIYYVALFLNNSMSYHTVTSILQWNFTEYLSMICFLILSDNTVLDLTWHRMPAVYFLPAIVTVLWQRYSPCGLECRRGYIVTEVPILLSSGHTAQLPENGVMAEWLRDLL